MSRRHIDIIIPTRHRPEKLGVCLDSIPREIPGESGKISSRSRYIFRPIDVRVVVICDADPATAAVLVYHDRVDQLILVREHSGSVFCRNLATQTAEDMVLYAVDDMEFLPGSIKAAARALKRIYGTGDGVIGLHMENRTPRKGGSGNYAGVALVGQKFLQRYPNRQLFFPGYRLFAAQEVTNLAVRLNRLYMEQEAKFLHHSPSKTGEQGDQTHAEGRVWKARDRDLRRKRSATGVLWGAE